MRILLLTDDHSLANYGVTTVLSQLVDEMAVCCPDFDLHIVTTSNDAVPQFSRIKISRFPMAPWAKLWRWRCDLNAKLTGIFNHENPDLVHIHGIWFAIQFFGIRIALQKKIPVLISIHGMWEPWLWQSQNFLKRFKYKIYMGLFLRKYFKTGVHFHAITPQEKESIFRVVRPFIPEVVSIPNAIPIQDDAVPMSAPEKNILFLGRIHPKKGVDLLVRAFHAAQLSNEWNLIIAGPEQDLGYVRQISEDIAKLGIVDRVRFTGPVFGVEKMDMLQRAWLMAVPSYSEAIGMVNLEAAANFLPSVTTYATGLHDWEMGGGYLINPDIDELKKCLIASSKWSLAERYARGARSRKLVYERYSYAAILPRWKEIYTRLAQG